MSSNRIVPVVAISQRVVEEISRPETRDALDQGWAALLESFGAIVVPVPNLLVDLERWLSTIEPSLIILSGGNDLAHLGTSDASLARDSTEDGLVSYATKNRTPLLGVCRGMQFLVHSSGGTLTSVTGHVGSSHVVSSVDGDRLWSWSGVRTVNSFHNWGVAPDGLPSTWRALAVAPDGSIESIEHKTLPQFGIMWHPERGECDSRDTILIESLLKMSQ
ncbi:MAG: gamma-glutamyl-gamma-aminobutyrate hydrolase family protein [Actinomycetes bacterium]